MLVRIEMSGHDPSVEHAVDLRAEFPLDLACRNPPARKPGQQDEQRIGKLIVAVRQRRNFLPRRHRAPTQQCQVHAHAEPRIGTREFHRIIERRPVGH